MLALPLLSPSLLLYSMARTTETFSVRNENPIYFYEHILNPFSMCNHCFYVFSFIFSGAARIPFHSIGGGSFNSTQIFIYFPGTETHVIVSEFTLADQSFVCALHCSNSLAFTASDLNGETDKNGKFFCCCVSFWGTRKIWAATATTTTTTETTKVTKTEWVDVGINSHRCDIVTLHHRTFITLNYHRRTSPSTNRLLRILRHIHTTFYV